MGGKGRLFDQLNAFRGSQTIIMGLGNVLKGDDAVGPFICEQLVGKISAELIDAGTVPENYIQPVIKKAPQNLVIIDAIDFGASAGTIRIFKPDQLNSVIISTHTLSPRVFVDLLRQEVKVDVYFIGIQPAQIQLGQSISAEVSRAAQELTDMLTGIFPPGE